MKTVTPILEHAWQMLCKAHSKNKINNISVMAFQFCNEIQYAHPDLIVSFDGRFVEAEPEKPNFVIWEKSNEPTVLFFGTLIFNQENLSSPNTVTKSLLSVIKQNSFEVCCNSAEPGHYLSESIPLSSEFEFGLFHMTGDGQTGFGFKSLWGPMTKGQLEKFHFAQNVAETADSSERKTSYRKPFADPGNRRGHEIPDLSFNLDHGRKVYVEALIWEPTYSDTNIIQSGEEGEKFVAEHKRLKTEELFGNRPILLLDADYLDVDPPRIANTAITVWLSSLPLAEDVISSELVVTFFVDYPKNSSLEEILSQSLHDLDWEEHAMDATFESIGLWEDNWLVKPHPSK